MSLLSHYRQQGACTFRVTTLGVGFVQGCVIRFLGVRNRAVKEFPALARGFAL